ncbi:MAG: UDP-N-acetylmuramate--L-alanine ligase [Chloroflexota bacterium]|nr:UDP-N-acetylmuramate--L-alanine ligase [Chloroflexota bacterium]
MLKLRPGQHIHLIGIGGAGLSAIARILLQRGFIVSGSDLRPSGITAALQDEGARVYRGHHADFVDGADLVLMSSAVAAEHAEARAAQSKGIPIVKRNQFMAPLLEGHRTIAVAGTHGKTTTTAMIAHILRQAGEDPSYIVGGTMGNTGTNAGVGAGQIFVIEADEYDNMFHGLRPQIAVVTNVEHDHPDYFATAEDQFSAFAKFAELVPASGALVACSDDSGALNLLNMRKERGISAASYAIDDASADWRATELLFSENETRARIFRHGIFLDSLVLGLPGAHNVLNALAAAIVAELQGVGFEESAAALASFKGAKRRFEIRGIRDDVIIVDDYAHHPTEIRVNIQAARARYPRHRIWVIWQPHTFSRTREFWSDFLSAFDAADHVLITPIYAAREDPIPGISSPMLVESMAAHPSARFAPDFEDAVACLRRDIAGPTVALICSAGDANRIADLYLEADV